MHYTNFIDQKSRAKEEWTKIDVPFIESTGCVCVCMCKMYMEALQWNTSIPILFFFAFISCSTIFFPWFCVNSSNKKNMIAKHLKYTFRTYQGDFHQHQSRHKDRWAAHLVYQKSCCVFFGNRWAVIHRLRIFLFALCP